MDIRYDFHFDAKTEGGLFSFPVRVSCLIEVTVDHDRCGDLETTNRLCFYDLFLGETRINDTEVDALSNCPFMVYLRDSVAHLTLEQMEIDMADLVEEITEVSVD